LIDTIFLSILILNYYQKQSGSETFLSDITPLPDEYMHLDSIKISDIKMSISTSSFSSLSMTQSPRNNMKSVFIKYVRLDEFDSILENETLV
jgi:hypothetical protein